jgi:fucose permease
MKCLTSGVMAMGYISDETGSMLLAYIVPLISFIPILYFGLKGHKVVLPSVVQSINA